MASLKLLGRLFLQPSIPSGKITIMKTQIATILFASALTLATGAPPAPAAGAASAGRQVQVGTLNGAASAPVNAANNVGPSANAAAQPTVNPATIDSAATANSSGSATGSNPGGIATPTVGADANLTTGTGVASPRTNTTPSISPAAMALDSQATTRQIRSNTFEARDAVTRNVESRLDSTRDLISTTGGQAANLDAAAPARLQSAITVARAREAQVRPSLRAVKVAREENYDAARNQLAQDYDAYATAVAQVEAIGKATANVTR